MEKIKIKYLKLHLIYQIFKIKESISQKLIDSLFYAFNFSKTSSTSIPWTSQASSKDSCWEAGQDKQCIPISSKISALSGATSKYLY